MDKKSEIYNDFRGYQTFLTNYFPKFEQNEDDLFSFYIQVNNAFVLSDILIEHDKINSSVNYYNILIEYREFYARLLTTITLNDEFLVENILRLIIEKLYRMLYGKAKANTLEKNIRKKDRNSMKNELEKSNRMGTENISLQSLNDLYDKYSGRIHHTVASMSDYYDLTKRLNMRVDNLLNDFILDLKIIEHVFVSEIFMKLIVDINKESTAIKMKVRNRTTSEVVEMLGL
ncbi:hypothetical protein KQ236_11895 [Lactococcus lactis]|nr:hypothetical protein [Lactococcus lactis]